MTKDDLFAPLARARGQAVVVTTMAAVRAWGRHSASELDFASADSAMGHAADLALGVALAQPRRKVICLNGDGSMLMSLGTLVTIIDSRARNLVLFVLVNRTYEITGNQAVPGANVVDFAALATAAGFRRVYEFSAKEDCEQHLAEVLEGEGPVFVVAHVAPGDDRPLRRGPSERAVYLQLSLADSAHRLRHVLAAIERQS